MNHEPSLNEGNSKEIRLEFIKLITYGRKSGLPHTVILRFVTIGNSFYVVAGHKHADWYKNALSSGSAKVKLGNLVYIVAAEPASEKEKEEVRSFFVKKYGARVVNLWYSNFSEVLKLKYLSKPISMGYERGEKNTSLSFKEWQEHKKDYMDTVSEAFDSASEEYDFTISRNYINTLVRKISINTLLKYAKKEDVLLEVGCGTGKEAVILSRHVSKIYATDISEGMLKLVYAKAKKYSLSSKIVPFKLRACELSKIRKITEEPFNIIYSFNGALNCEPELDRFVEEAYALLSEGGYMICSIRNRFCISEMLIHAFLFQFDKTIARKKQPVMISVGGMDIPAYYYSPYEFINRLSKHFHLVRIVGLPVLLPPAYLSNYYVKLGKVRTLLEVLESRVSSLFPFNRFGDQTLFVFRKK